MSERNEKIGNDKVLKERIAERMAKITEKGLKQSKILVGGSPPGLTLQVTAAGSASWLLRITVAGKRRELGLGVYRRKDDPVNAPGRMSLRDARDMGEKIYAAARTGIDPVAALRSTQEEKSTFKKAAKAYIKKEASEWDNPKHAKQWASTLKKWVYPIMGDKAVEAIDVGDIEKVLLQPVDKAEGKPLWVARHVTARRVRQRMEAVLRYAAAKGWRDQFNPAALSGPIMDLLPGGKRKKRRKIHKVRSHPALPYADAPAFMADLRERKGTAAQALQFLIYTAARSGEVRHAEWSEIDLDKALWVRPDEKMKAGEAHTVPLSEPALAILRAIPESRRKGLVFPSKVKRDTAMSDMTLAAVLKRMNRRDITVHGFRATFRTWADAKTAFNRNVKESAIAHTIGESDTERAYLRDDYLEQRKALMRDWAQYVTGDSK